MKDYSLNLEEKNEFVLNYKIDNDRILINFANGDKVIIPYTEENEKKILDVMERQVRLSDKKLDNLKNERLAFSILGTICLLLILLGTIGLNLGVYVLPLFSQIVLGLGAGITVFCGINVINITKEIKDIKKNKYFLENESILNDRVKDNENMLYKTHSVTKNLVKKSKEDEVVFTINSVDNIPFSDLEQIMSNISREDTFNFEYPKDNEKTMKKTN